MVVRAAGFDWDDGNRAKCQKHGVSLKEIESLFSGQTRVAPDLKHSGAEDRLIAVGRTLGRRPLFVAFTLRVVAGATFIRPISARYMHAEEIARYDAQDT